jgi:ABC-2 type transport system permease protein
MSSEPQVVHAPPVAASVSGPSRMRRELGVIVALWHRDMLRFRRDTGRWVGLVVQPLLIWGLLGAGMRERLVLPGGSAGDALAFYLPGAIAMIALFTSIFATMGVIEDRQHGFLQQVLVAPSSRLAMIVGKALGVLSVALIQLALTVPAFALAGLDLGAVAWPVLVLTFTLGVLSVTVLSFCLAWLVRTTHAYHALMGVFLIPLWLVSGALFPLPDGGFIRWVNTVNPLAYMVDGLRSAMGPVDAAVTAFPAGVPLLVLGGATLLGLLLASRVARRPVTGGPA